MATHNVVISKIEITNNGGETLPSAPEFWTNEQGVIEGCYGGGESGWIDITAETDFFTAGANTSYVEGVGWIYNSSAPTDLSFFEPVLDPVYDAIYVNKIHAALLYDYYNYPTNAPDKLRITVNVTAPLDGTSSNIRFDINHPDASCAFYYWGDLEDCSPKIYINSDGTSNDIQEYVVTYDIVDGDGSDPSYWFARFNGRD